MTEGGHYLDIGASATAANEDRDRATASDNAAGRKEERGERERTEANLIEEKLADCWRSG